MKKQIKKIVATVTLLITIIINIVNYVYAYYDVDIENINFNTYTYRADIYTENGTVCYKTIYNMLNADMPSDLVVQCLDRNSLFQNEVTAWKVLHVATSPSEVTDTLLDEKGYYTCIILSIFKAQTQNDKYVLDCLEEINEESNSIFSNIKNWVENVDELGNNIDLQKMSDKEKKEIKEKLGEIFKQNHPKLTDYSDFTSDISKVFECTDTLWDAIELMESYIKIYELSDSMKNVLLNMYNNCENVILKSALKECADASKSLNCSVKETIAVTAKKEIIDVFGELADIGWEKLIEQSVYTKCFMAGAKAGTWIGDSVCNILFSTDK